MSRRISAFASFLPLALLAACSSDLDTAPDSSFVPVTFDTQLPDFLDDDEPFVADSKPLAPTCLIAESEEAWVRADMGSQVRAGILLENDCLVPTTITMTALDDIDGAFWLESDLVGATVMPGGQLELVFGYSPVAEMIHVGALTIQTDQGNLETLDVMLVGALKDGQYRSALPPVAEAGPRQVLQTGSTVVLDGSASYDPELDPLTYRWTFKTIPTLSTLSSSSIASSTSEVASFVPDVDGEYRVRFYVDDGTSGDKDFVTIVAAGDAGEPPVADAGPNIALNPGVPWVGDGTGSYDPEGGPFSYAWVFTRVPVASAITNADLIDADTATPSFLPDTIGQYVLKLQVDDGLWTDNDWVQATVSEGDNDPPVADAGPDGTGTTGDPINPIGSASDPNNDPLTYAWKFTSVPQGSVRTKDDITGVNTLTPSFVPDIAGTYELRLAVSDVVSTDMDYVQFTVTGDPIARPPIAEAGPRGTGTVGELLTTDGSASYDPDGEPITYSWSFKTIPPGSALVYADIQDAATANASITPDVAGEYRFRLVVRSGASDGDKDFVSYDVTDPATR